MGVFGGALGLISQALNDLALAKLGPEPEAPRPEQLQPQQVVILGGGFAGMTTARNLEEVFGPHRSVSFTLVSETNAFMFTPILAEVAGSVWSRAISVPPHQSPAHAESEAA